VKAICLGARAVLIGRAYGLAAAGEAGVSLREDVERTLRLLGRPSVVDLSSGTSSTHLNGGVQDHSLARLIGRERKPANCFKIRYTTQNLDF